MFYDNIILSDFYGDFFIRGDIMMYDNLVGSVFNNLKVVEQAPDYVSSKGKHERMWKCECLLCGDFVVTRERSLKSGHIKSCGRKHRRVEDLTDQVFGDLKVIDRAPNVRAKDGSSYVMWNCECECGNKVVVRASSLKNHHTQSCGVCSRSRSNMGRGLDDITGQEFGFWKVIEKSRSLIQPNGRRVTLWKCQCKCDEIRELRAGTLKQGLSLSCGCHKLEVLREKAALGFGVSKHENFVSDFLVKKGFYFEPQKTYSDLRGDSGYPLSYDFLVYIDFEPAFLIECQGRQHYEPIEYFGGEERFIIQQKNDNYKRGYAKRLNLFLLEIPYNVSLSEIESMICEMISSVTKFPVHTDV